jgi:perosamine synthetase
MSDVTPVRSPPKKIYASGPSITDLEVKLVQDALVRGAYEAPYYYVEEFQKAFAAWHGRKHGIMTPNCTTAVHLTLAGLGVKPGDEVIAPELTWIGSTAGIKHCGARAVFADVDPDNWCLDPRSVEQRITPRTKAIIAVGLHGNMPDLPALEEVAKRHGIHLIEDAAQSLGSTLHGRKAGTYGVASVFSFHRTKTLSTVEGGMMLTDDTKLWERCMFLRDHGRSSTIAYYNLEVAFKYIPTNLQAALGYAQLQRLDELLAKKRLILQWYREKLADIPDIALNPEPPGGVNAVWVPGLVFGRSHKITKQQAMDHFARWGLPGRPFFYPLSSLPAYDEADHYRKHNPVAYDLSERGIDLPSALNMTEEDASYVAECIHDLVRRTA